jgi:Tfp pilus assembly protein PilN
MLGLSKGLSLGGTIPRHLTTLSVSWLNQQLKAVAVHRGKVTGTWERPETAADAAGDFEAFIREAVQKTGYHGQTVSLVLAHPRLVQHMLDVPPVKWAALNKLIQRQAAQQKFFPGEAAYAYQMLASAKKSPRVLLHLLPRLILNQFMLACRRNDLHLVSVLPASVALQQQLAALSLQKSDVVMLAAETAGSTTLVICDGDGRLLLARTLQGTWNEDPAKLALDLNRTILFLSQQLSVSLNRGLCLFGTGAAKQAEELQRQIQLPVNASPVAYEPFYWATESLKVRPEGAPNFQSPELQKAPQRRVFAKIVATAATLLLAACIAWTAYSIIQSRREQATLASLQQQVTHMEARQIEVDQLDSELKRKQQAIQLVLGDRPPPKPAWLLAYLGQVVPADLVVTNFSVKRENDYYRVKLAGTYQAASVTPNAPPVADSIENLKSALAASPFHMRILETDAAGKIIAPDKAAPKPSGLRVPIGDWLKGVTDAVSAKLEPKKRREVIDHFVIEGVMR